jgi:hypothetical protein
MNDHCMALYKKNTSQTVIKMKQNNNFITKVNVEIYTEYCIIWLLHIFLNAQIYYFFVEDCGEWDISLRGRIRKRRIIPNNVEDQGLSKKRKGDSLSLTSTHVPNILSHGKPIQATANMISLVTSSPSQSGGQSPGHLLLHTSGGQTYYTGLNEQSLSSLRMLSHSKQTAHPIIQQLLRQPGMTSPRPLVNTTVSSTSQSKSCSIYSYTPATKIFTLCRMITWVVFLRMFWNFINSLPVKSGGSLSFLTIFTFAVPELLNLIWRKIGFLPYVVW